MKTASIALTLSLLASSDIPKLRFVDYNGAKCPAESRAIGVSEDSATTGEVFPVNTLGVLIVESGDALAVGDAVESDAEGRAVTVTTGAVNGWAMDAATAAGEIIRIRFA